MKLLLNALSISANPLVIWVVLKGSCEGRGRVHQVLKLESEADNMYHEEMAKLFTECTDQLKLSNGRKS